MSGGKCPGVMFGGANVHWGYNLRELSGKGNVRGSRMPYGNIWRG